MLDTAGVLANKSNTEMSSGGIYCNCRSDNTLLFDFTLLIIIGYLLER